MWGWERLREKNDFDNFDCDSYYENWQIGLNPDGEITLFSFQ